MSSWQPTVVWAACWPVPCMVWPLALGTNPGSCGICGQREFSPRTAPADGKACRA